MSDHATATTSTDDAAAITAFLERADVCCPTCGYRLTGCPTNRCPECGEAFVFRLGRRLGGAAWWWTAVAGVAMATGPVALFAVIRLFKIAELTGPEVRMLMGDHGKTVVSYAADLPNTFRFVALATLLGVALVWLINARRAWRLMSARAQVILGVLGAAMPMIVLGLLALMISL
jgi:hypothetical protein